MTGTHGTADEVLERSHAAWAEFAKGDPLPVQALFSRKGDVCVGNPFGPFAHGWNAAKGVMDRAAENWREGEGASFELISRYAAADLVCYVEVERYRAKIGGASELASVELRVTTVIREEDDGWKIVHRHADPITSPRPAESVIQK